MNKNKTVSREKLISDSEESDCAYNNETTQVEIHFKDAHAEDKDYVMRKFLNKTNAESGDIPIPRQRTKQFKSEEYNNDAVKPFRKDEDADSNFSKASNATYDVPVPKKRNKLKQQLLNESPPSTSAKEEIEMKEFINYENEVVKIPKVPVRKNVGKAKKRNMRKKTEEVEDTFKYDEVDNIPKSKLDDLGAKTKKCDDNQIENKCDKNAVEKALKKSEVLTINIGRMDKFVLDSFVLHLKIRVHFVDRETGNYIKKSTSPNSSNDDDDYIPAVTSQPYSFLKNKQMFPNWNVVFSIQENFEYLCKNDKLILFFEIIGSTQDVDDEKEKSILSWAFLKPQNNYNENVRLQLYYPGNTKKGSVSNSYTWWKEKKLRKYPSSISVSLMSTDLFSTSQDTNKLVQNKPTPKGTEIPKKQENILTKMEDSKVFEIKTDVDGCFVHKFSHSGEFLAICTSEDGAYNIIIYTTNNMEKLCQLESHRGLIYDLAWTSTNRRLISASADCCVAVWDVMLQKFETIWKHPAYVYCCACGNDELVASGGYDCCIRIWSLLSLTLLHELKEHKSYVTSICFNKSANFMYSSDSTGHIIMWQNERNSWHIKQEINVLDLRDVIINEIILHRRERRLIVNSRDGFLRLVDIKTGYVMQTFSKAAADRNRSKCTISKCGTYMISGNNIGEVRVWNLDNGKIQYVFSPYDLDIPIHCVQLHNNLVTVSHFGNELPLIGYKFKNPATDLGQNMNVDAKYDLSSLQKHGTDMRKILEKFDSIITANKTK